MAKSSASSGTASRADVESFPRTWPAMYAWAAVGLLLGVAVYTVSFCLSSDLRRAILVQPLIPDVLALQWVGGDPARFGLFDRLPLLLVAGIILAVGVLSGRLVLDLLRVDRLLSGGERFVFAAGIGMNALSLLILAMGLAGQLRSAWWFYLLAAVVVVLCLVRWRYWRRLPEPTPRGEPETVPRLILALAAILTFVILLGGMLPPWHFDVREYHLEIPKEWFQQGRIGFVPHNVYGNMPLGAEMHALLGMLLVPLSPSWWWGALVGKTVIAAFAPLTAFAVFACGRRFFGPTAAAFAALFFLATPWVAHVSMAGLIDGLSAFNCLLAVHAGLLGNDLQRGGTVDFGARWGIPAVSGFLAGAGVACKYPAVLFLVTPMFVWFLCARPGWLHPRTAAVFLLATALGCGPWLAKNWVLSGNPTYPLLYNWFDGRTRTPEKDAQWKRAHSVLHHPGGNPYTFRHLRDSLKLVMWSSQFASPILVPFVVVGLFARRHRRVVLALSLFCGFVLAAWWLATHRVDRFLLPILPLAALVAGVGATWSGAVWWQRSVRILVTVGAVFALLINLTRYNSDNRFLVSLNDLRIDAPNPHDPDYFQNHTSHLYLNQAVREGYRVLAVGDAQAFDFTVPVLYNTCFDDCQFEQLMRGRTREQRYAALRERRISHLFVYWSEIDRYRSPGNYGYSDFVTRDLIRRELVDEQRLLQPIPLDDHPENSQVFEVVGWRDW